VSRLLEFNVKNETKKITDADDNLKFSASVAAWGMKLKKSIYLSNFSYEDIILLARDAKGEDKDGYKAEFIGLAEKCKELVGKE
jgi:Ca-activated chloride channel family protein